MSGPKTEDSIVRMLRDRFGGRGGPVKIGIGDDAAVIRLDPSEDLVVTTDILVEEVDFYRTWFRPEQLGHKALAVNLSDLAAMGARPRVYLAALSLPPDISPRWISGFYNGMKRLGKEYGAVLAGGDLSRSPSGIQISIIAAGETLKRSPVLRSGGKPGDALLVTGVLGRSAAGLELLKEGITRGYTAAQRHALQAHRMPAPRCEVGLWLARNGLARCMMDLSDGLSADLPRLCAASGVGAELDGAHLPVFPASALWGCDPVHLALHGGEDFELLFSVSSRRLPRLLSTYPRTFPPATVIGRLTRGRRVLWKRDASRKYEPLQRLGFDHFG